MEKCNGVFIVLDDETVAEQLIMYYQKEGFNMSKKIFLLCYLSYLIVPLIISRVKAKFNMQSSFSTLLKK